MRPRWQAPGSFAPRWVGGDRSPVKTLVAANVAAFVCQIILDATVPGFTDRWLALSREGLLAGFLWQPVTYMFLHGGLLHLLFNMLVIYFAGRQVEQLLGPRHFLTLYFAGGIAGGLAQSLLLGDTLVGASAAGYATLIAFATILPEVEITLLLFFVLPVRVRAKYLAWGAIGVSLLFTLFPIGDQIGHLAHLVGCLVGWVYVRRLGYGQPLAIERRIDAARARVARRESMSAEEFMQEEIDPILDKISRLGMHSLTRRERRILEMGRSKFDRPRH